MRWILLVLMVLTLVGGGCFEPCSRYTELLEWEEPGLYEQFPPEGKYDGISVTWDTQEEGFQIEGKNALVLKGNPSFSIHVRETNVTKFLVTYDRPVSDERLHQDMNATFATLGLAPPIPAVEGWSVTFLPETC